MQLVAATANPHKLAEIEVILAGAGLAEAGLATRIQLLPRPGDLGDIVEDGDTLEANARLKAAAVCRHTGMAAVADDTGLEVAALGGAPGVRSARYAGEHAADAGDDAANRAKLLAELEGVTDRSARFRTVAMVVFPEGSGRADGAELVAEGIVTGTIAREARGHDGFGYDPLFVPDEGDGRTFAEMSLEEKNAISHRGRAFRALAAKLLE
ncbi:RdgB/HAM1 family non-canonical purine NTP pyrophosphatase [Candidatus Poriferisocius sp.]|uniref:RdgB/HAM1 family non-canonical purine NTP pyrophosphatase n=1 Tax=Candidatus Poriferisocius sp. TaxID=3101276 RepID=UPI003B5CF944